jgi:hypothetical protein
MKKEIPKFDDKLTEVTIFRMPVGVRKILDDVPFVKGSLEVETERALEGLILKLRAYVLADKPIALPLMVREPASWWQHFKRDQFPVAWLRRWPVEYVDTQLHLPYQVFVCPHATIAWPGENCEHIKFLMDAP